MVTNTASLTGERSSIEPFRGDSAQVGTPRSSAAEVWPEAPHPDAVGDFGTSPGGLFVPAAVRSAVAPTPATQFDGVARNVIYTGASEQAGGVLTFRIERHDARGDRLSPIPVELRASLLSAGTIMGSLSDGDEVRVSGKWKDGTLAVKSVHNLTTGATVSGKALGVGGKIFVGFCFAFVATVLCGVGYAFLAAFIT